MTTWNKRLRPVAAIMALLTVGGLFGAVSANAVDVTGNAGGNVTSTVSAAGTPSTADVTNAAVNKAAATVNESKPIDQGTEAYIKSHMDAKYVGSGGTLKTADALTTVATIVDGNRFKGKTLDDLWADRDGDGVSDQWDTLLDNAYGVAALYDTGQGQYYVAQVGNPANGRTTLQALAGRNDTSGTVYNDVVYDDKTNLAYVPKHYLKDAGNQANSVRLQILSSVKNAKKASDIDVKVSESGVKGDVTSDGVASVGTGNPVTQLRIAKDADARKSISDKTIDSVKINDIEYGADSGVWSYDTKTGNLTINMSATAINNVAVTMSNTPWKAISGAFGALAAKKAYAGEPNYTGGVWRFSGTPRAGQAFKVQANNMYQVNGKSSDGAAPRYWGVMPVGVSPEDLVRAIINGTGVYLGNFDSHGQIERSTYIGQQVVQSDGMTIQLPSNMSTDLALFCAHVGVDNNLNLHDGYNHGSWDTDGAFIRILAVNGYRLTIAVVNPTQDTQSGVGIFYVTWQPSTYGITASTQVQTTKDDGKEPWVNGGTTADGKYVYGEIDHDTNWVRDTVTITAHDGIKPTGAMFNIDYWLHCVTADGKDLMVKKSQADQFSGVIWQNQSATVTGPAFTSMDLWGKPYWPMNAKFFFDVNVMRGVNNDASVWPGGMVQTFGENDKNESWFRKSTDLTVATEARYYDANGNGVSASPTLNGSQSVLDHLSITPTDQWVRSNETLTYTVTLNYDYDKNGTVDKSVTKTKTESTYGGWATGQIHEADSDKFTAADLGLKGGWKPGAYWFDVTVSRSDVAAAPSLSKDSYVHEGKNDAKEKFEVKDIMPQHTLPSVSTKVTADTARDGNPVKDQVTVTMPANRTDFKVTGVTVKARGRLYWSPDKGTEGEAVPQNAKKIADLTPLTFTSDMLADGSETLTYDPAADNALKAVGAQSRLGTGYYTYVWRLDKSDLKGQTATLTWSLGMAKITQTETTDVLFQNMKDTVPDGWKPGAEQTTMDATWTPTILKLGHVGQADGKWMDSRPAANAILNMAETTDATGRALASTAQTSQIQLKQDGTGVFPTQVIGMGQTRYYKIWESRVGKPFNVPKNGAYWMVTAKQVPGTTGVQLTVTGTSDETRWLVRTWSGTDNGSSAGSGLKNNPVDWKVTLGDTLDANVTPPSTGGTADTLRMWAVIAAATGLAAAGALTAVTRRSAHAGRHSA